MNREKGTDRFEKLRDAPTWGTRKSRESGMGPRLWVYTAGWAPFPKMTTWEGQAWVGAKAKVHRTPWWRRLSGQVVREA